MKERATSGVMPGRIWDERMHGRRALWTTLKLWWMEAIVFRREKPTIDPEVEKRVRVARMALDVAEMLKFNDKAVNMAVLEQAQRLLDSGRAAESTTLDTAFPLHPESRGSIRA